MNINLSLVSFLASVLFLFAPIVLTIYQIKQDQSIKAIIWQTLLLIVLGTVAFTIGTDVEPHVPLKEVVAFLFYGGYVLALLLIIRGLHWGFKKLKK